MSWPLHSARAWLARVPLLACLLACLLAALTAAPVWAQPGGAVSGRVLGPAGEPVQGAGVEARPASGNGRRTTTTGADGTFRIPGLRAGPWSLRASRVGFGDARQTVSGPATGDARVELRLVEAPILLETVEVRSPRETQRERTRFETEAGVTARVISGDEIKMLPGLGEADVLRAVEVLPGVVSTSDFSSAFNVRGGSSDQNLILLDGFPVFNPFHLGGLFSVFNSDVIARAELLSGGFGAQYGGRVSSVLTVESKTGEGGLHAETGISVLATRIAVHSDLPRAVSRSLGGQKGSWLFSARRSYFDALLRPVTDFPYHLTDVQAGASIETRGGGRVQFTGYRGRDVLDLSNFDPPGEEDTAESILKIRWNWGNDVAGLKWTQPLGSRWVSETRLGVSRYGEILGFPDFADTRFGSNVQEAALRSDLTRQISPRLTVQAGGELNRVSYSNLGESGGTTFFEASQAGLFAAGYGQVRWQPSPLWIVEPGLRVDVARTNAGACASGGRPDYFPQDPSSVPARANRTCVIPAPRVAVKRFLGAERDAAVKIAAGRYVQFLHSIRDEALPVSNDTWVLADEYVPPVVSDQVQAGVEKYWGERWYASLEGYYRRYDGVTDLNPGDDPNFIGDDLLVGDGDSYGADLLVRRNAGRLTGWTTLSWLKAARTFPDPTAAGLDGVPQTVTYAPIFDRRLDVDVVLQYELSRRTQLGLRWNYGSGTPFTRPVAQVVGFETNVAAGGYRLPRPETDEPEVPYYVVLADRNRERYPAYHRLDLTLRREYTRRWGSFTPYLQVLNGYNQRNVLFYFYNYDKAPATRSGISMFPLLPSIGVEASF
ncbi:MAG TPA: carboxypeptidase regulatory-like domain-containing protein [Longimicrobium sp.]|uniref:TonB-dependent receptor n=1 Tax=Longimicrobium sp. TaxID=2029185 RepID=UPI002ED7FF6E